MESTYILIGEVVIAAGIAVAATYLFLFLLALCVWGHDVITNKD
jgi:hypothetical protein